MRYKCIIFDCDGVLVDSEEITTKVLIELAASLGLEINLEYANKFFPGKSLQSIFQFIQERIDQPLPEDLEAQFRAKTFERFKKEIQPINGISELLEKLKIPFCVASSGPLHKIELNLTTTGLIDKFRGKMFSCYEVGKWKPDPAIFEYAAQRMGYAVEECVVVEDSVYGVQAAKSGGFDVYGFANERNKEALEKAGAIVFFRMEDLYPLLNATE
ncbi:MAG: HAD family hydrolase [Bacteroidota bacterium]